MPRWPFNRYATGLIVLVGYATVMTTLSVTHHLPASSDSFQQTVLNESFAPGGDPICVKQPLDPLSGSFPPEPRLTHEQIAEARAIIEAAPVVAQLGVHRQSPDETPIPFVPHDGWGDPTVAGASIWILTDKSINGTFTFPYAPADGCNRETMVDKIANAGRFELTVEFATRRVISARAHGK